MPSDDVKDKALSATPKKGAPTTPQRSTAVKRQQNVTSERKGPVPVLDMPKTAPPRVRATKVKKNESTLLGDFLLGRPSPQRPRRKSLDAVKAEINAHTISKLQRPGGVQDRVKQWQKSSETLDDPFVTTISHEPTKGRRQLSSHDSPSSSVQKNATVVPAVSPKVKTNTPPVLPIITPTPTKPHKRVVSDDHWMHSKNKQKPSKKSPIQKASFKSYGLPADFLERRTAVSPLSVKIKDWNAQTVQVELNRGKSKESSAEVEDDGWDNCDSTTSFGNKSTALETNDCIEKNSSLDTTTDISVARCARRLPNEHDSYVRVRETTSKSIVQESTLPGKTLQHTADRRMNQSGHVVERKHSTSEAEDSIVSQSESSSAVSLTNNDSHPRTPRKSGVSTKASAKAYLRTETTSPDPLPDIPVGRSAFSVLDLSADGGARNKKTAKPTARNHSFNAVPQVLKKVYNGGKRMVQDAVDPPRPGVNLPPSIESWLNATSDPFMQPEKLTAQSHEEVSSLRPSLIRRVEVGGHAELESEVVATSIHAGQGESPRRLKSRRTESAVIRTHKDLDADVQHSPGLKRSPAARKTLYTSKEPRAPLLKGGFADAFRGQSNSTWTKSQGLSPQERVSEKCERTEPRAVRSPLYEGQDGEKLQNLDTITKHHAIRTATNSIMEDALPGGSDSRLLLAASRTLVATAPVKKSTKDDLECDELANCTRISSVAGFHGNHSRRTAPTSAPYSSKSAKAVARSRSTKHSDLMTVLSMPDTDPVGRSMSIRSANSVRTIRTSLESTSLDDLLHELAEDEAKYMRELEILVNGVIPVLISRVLTESDNLNPTSSRGSSASTAAECATKQHIVEIGIALERLKSSHRKIPLRDPHLLVQWATKSYTLYEAYLAAWRTGFEGLIVKLAPSSDETRTGTGELPRFPASAKANREDGLDHKNQSADVGFLLKRPLVRIKHLARITKGVYKSMPNEETLQLKDRFQALLFKTRRRSKEEQARREDIAALDTDTSRVRDLRNLTLFSNTVHIDGGRQVKATDFFNMDLQHSSGQRLVCRVELIIRDEPQQGSEHGDVLMCEVESLERWLLFPPLELRQLSARMGASPREIVLYIVDSRISPEWLETILLTAGDDSTALEWVQMLEKATESTAVNGHTTMRLPSHEHPLKAPENLHYAGASGDMIDVPFGESKESFTAQRSDRLDDDDRRSPFETIPKGSNVQEGIPQHLLPLKAHSSDRRRNIEDDATTFISSPYQSHPNHPRIESTRAIAGAGTSTPKHDTPSAMIEGHMLLPDVQLSRDGVNVQHTTSLIGDDASISSKYVYAPPMNNLPVDVFRTQAAAPPCNEGDSDSTTSARVQRDRPSKDLQVPQSRGTLKFRSKKTKASVGSSSVSNRSSRRSSSPLKHEYHPSNASDTSSAESGSDTCSATLSDSSEDEDFEEVELPLLLPGLPSLVSGLPEISISPDNDERADASSRQTPARGWGAPDQHDAIILIASVSCWIDKGRWDMLHPELCSVKITAGLIEVFKLSAAHSPSGHVSVAPDSIVAAAGSSGTDQPLVAFDLTPLVPLRQSTALDIEVRSPPLPRSIIKCTGTVRFRTRTAEDCHKFYAAIHRARLDNPIFKRLEQERILNGYGQQSRQSDIPGSRRRNWFGRKASYRASARAPSVSTSDVQSRGSLGTAIDVLRKLGSGGGYNIDRSTIAAAHDGLLSRSGATSLHTSSAGSVSSGLTPPRSPISMSVVESSVQSLRSHGTRNLKIRLYRLDTVASWTDMGACRITIEVPPPGQRQASTLYSGIPHLVTVTSKKLDSRMDDKENVQLDPRRLSFGHRRMSLPAVVGPKKLEDNEERREEDYNLVLRTIIGGNSILRQNRTGIAINIWEEMVGPNGELGMVSATGGVGGRTRKWMFQFGSAQETAWVYAVLGGR